MQWILIYAFHRLSRTKSTNGNRTWRSPFSWLFMFLVAANVVIVEPIFNVRIYRMVSGVAAWTALRGLFVQLIARFTCLPFQLRWLGPGLQLLWIQYLGSAFRNITLEFSASRCLPRPFKGCFIRWLSNIRFYHFQFVLLFRCFWALWFCALPCLNWCVSVHWFP